MRRDRCKKEKDRYDYHLNIKAEAVKTQLFINSVKGFNEIH